MLYCAISIIIVILLAEITKRISTMESPLSDEEVFTGPLTLKEVKRRIWFSSRHTFAGCTAVQNDEQDGIKIIQTCSQPDLLCESSISLVASPSVHTISDDSPDPKWDGDCMDNLVLQPPIYVKDSPTHPVPDLLTESCITLVESPSKPFDFLGSPIAGQKCTDYNLEQTADESFLKLEQMVSDLCVKDGKGDLDNTLEVVDYILKHGPEQQGNTNNNPDKKDPKCIFHSTEIEGSKPRNLLEFTQNHEDLDTDSKNLNGNYLTPLKNVVKQEADVFATPKDEMKMKTPVFKTPANLVPSQSKLMGSSAKKNMMRNNAYQDIVSPVALYINKSPQVPLLRNVKPKKPLPSTSSIPKLVKSLSQNSISNKENVNLPTLAYKSAKKTKVIDIPDKDRLPQSQWAKKVSTSLPRPMVIKHNHREKNMTERLTKPMHEDSFGDLPLRQADVSVCTQKSAFNQN